MNNKMLATFMLLSTLTMPMMAKAEFFNSRIAHKGIFTIHAADKAKVINLTESVGGKGILLENGPMEITTEKVGNGFSIASPRLELKQNGRVYKMLLTDGDYHNDENFTVDTRESKLNYDLYLRKSRVMGESYEIEEVEACQYRVYSLHKKLENGTQKSRNTYTEVTSTYRLMLGVDSVLQGEFVSTTVKFEKTASELLEVCR